MTSDETFSVAGGVAGHQAMTEDLLRATAAIHEAAALVAEATSFGGVHATAERRGRWGTDDVPEGFIRYSAGCEDPEDLVADLTRALDAIPA